MKLVQIAITIALLLMSNISAQAPVDLECDLDNMLLAQADDDGQSFFGGGKGRRGRGPHGEDMERMGKHIDQLRMLKLLELLDLDEDQEVPFITNYRSVRKKIKAILDERRAVVVELTEAIRAESVTDEFLTQKIQELKDTDSRRQQAIHDAMDEARMMLRPEQAARLVVFQERFERELLDRVREFRNRKGGAPSDSASGGNQWNR